MSKVKALEGFGHHPNARNIVTKDQATPNMRGKKLKR